MYKRQVSKLVNTQTGDPISMSVRKVELEPIEFAPPCYTQGIQPKVKGAEEKISAGLTRLHDEDPSFETEFNPETKQHTISGAGDVYKRQELLLKLQDALGMHGTTLPQEIPLVVHDLRPALLAAIELSLIHILQYAKM